MARRPDPSKETAPERFPEVPPPAYAQAVGSTWLVESMMQMQHAVGELKATVEHLKATSDKQSSKLDRISHQIFAAGAVLAVVLAAVGFFMNKIWDGLVVLMKTTPTH